MNKITIIAIVVFFTAYASAQISSFPYKESFDTVTTPSLPVGWTTSTNKSASGDFKTDSSSTSSAYHSPKQFLISTDATKPQSLVSPIFNFTGAQIDSVEFFERRSSNSYASGLLVEASVNNDTLFSTPISDTLKYVSNSYTRRAFILPLTLHDQSNVRIRFRIIGNSPTGATSIIRFDDIGITTKKTVDLALTSIMISPAQPRNGDNVVTAIGVTNKALAGNFSFTVQLFDSLTFITSTAVNSLTLSANETTSVQVNYPNIKAGRHPLNAKLILTGDEDTTNNSISTVVNARYQPGTILINEFKHTGTPEWVEFINNTDDTINIAQWKIADNTATFRTITLQQTLIPPHIFFVVTAGELTEIYPSIAVPVIIPASFPAFNDGGDAVRIIDPNNFTIDSLSYDSSWPTISGKSFERVDIAGSSTLQSNWKSSVNPLGATPGFINSVTQKEFDLSLAQISISPHFPVTGNDVSVSSTIKNIGKQQTSSCTFRLYLDGNKDSIPIPDEILFQQSISSLNANDSIIINSNIGSLTQGTHWIIAKIFYAPDEDTTNNLFLQPVTIGIPAQSIIINEIMYAPTGDNPEWIEFYNNSSQSIAVNNWKISDVGTTKSVISNPNSIISSKSYFIVAADSSFLDSNLVSVPVFISKFPALNNSSPDAVVLFDERNAVMDSVYYKTGWGGANGMTLQRFDIRGPSTDSSNWRSSFPTPGKINTIIKKEFDVAIRRVTIFSSSILVNQPLTINATVENIGRQPVSSLSIEFYWDADNDSLPETNELQQTQLISALGTNDSVTVSGQITPAQSGVQRIFVKIVSSTDEDNTNNIKTISISVGLLPGSVVITEIMYNPQNEMPEWVEFYNKSSSSISIIGWKISDAGTTKSAIANPNSEIPAQSYFLVTTDSSFATFYSINAPLFISSFSALNNTTPDAVVIFDNQNRMIDSVYYKPSWGGTNGQTLQRFDIYSASTDSANWKSELPNVGTENSIARKDYDIKVKNISSAKSANGTRITAVVENVGRQTANSITIKFLHDINHDSTGQQNEEIHSVNIAAIAPMDSVSVEFDWVHSLQGKQHIIVTAEYSQDERFTNNSGFTFVTNSFASQSLVINEIMFEPLSGNSEFVELLNRSSDTIDIAEWKLLDQPSTSGSRAIIPLSQQPFAILPNDFFLVASDSSILTQFPSLAGKNVVINSSLSLNNSGEDLVLVDLTDAQIDSVRYSPSWHLKNFTSVGRSLERINPNTSSIDSRNWSSSVAKSGASPLQSNSIYIGSVAPSSSLTFTPNPFSPDNDGWQDFLSINYSLPNNSSTIRVRIYDVTGRLIKRLAQSEPSPSTGSLIWNGLDDDGHRVRIGMYIILFEALDNFGGVVKAMKDVAVVARKL